MPGSSEMRRLAGMPWSSRLRELWRTPLVGESEEDLANEDYGLRALEPYIPTPEEEAAAAYRPRPPGPWPDLGVAEPDSLDEFTEPPPEPAAPPVDPRAAAAKRFLAGGGGLKNAMPVRPVEADPLGTRAEPDVLETELAQRGADAKAADVNDLSKPTEPQWQGEATQKEMFARPDVREYFARVRADAANNRLRRPEMAASETMVEAGPSAEADAPQQTDDSTEDPKVTVAEQAQALVNQPGIAGASVSESRSGPGAPSTQVYHGVADRMMSPGGERPNMYGMEDEGGFNREARMRAAGEAYDRLSGPPEGHQWEDEFRERNMRPDDRWIHKNYRLRLLLNGDQAATAWRNNFLQEQQAYDQGLEQARTKDYERSGQRISRALAQSMAASGMDPEAVSQLRVNDPAVKMFVSGGYSQGTKLADLQQRLMEKQIAEMGKTVRSEHETGRTEMKNAAALERTRVQAEAGIGATPRPTEDAMAVAIKRRLQKSFPDAANKVGGAALLDAAERFSKSGDLADLPDAFRTGTVAREIRAEVRNLRGVAGTNELSPGPKGIAKERIERDTLSTKTPIIAAEDAAQTTIDALGMARAAWRQMPPEAKKAFVQLGSGDFTDPAKSKVLGPHRAQATRLYRVMNTAIKAFSGSAVSGSEEGRMASQHGVTPNGWDPFMDPSAFEQALADMYTITRKQLMRGQTRQEVQ